MTSQGSFEETADHFSDLGGAQRPPLLIHEKEAGCGVFVFSDRPYTQVELGTLDAGVSDGEWLVTPSAVRFETIYRWV